MAAFTIVGTMTTLSPDVYAPVLVSCTQAKTIL